MTKKRWILAVVVVALVVGVFSMVSYAGRIFPGGMAMGPNGKVLHRIAKKVIWDGVIYRRYVAREEDCLDCELRAGCLLGEKVRRRQLSVPLGAVPGNLLKAMAEKVDTERGREIYHQRIGIAEPVFANIRAVKGLDRFTLRGKIKVNIQWVLYCMVHNIGKIMSYGFA